MTYQKTGVPEAERSLVTQIRQDVESTNRLGVLGNLGGFGNCFKVPLGYQEPVLVSSTGGVGTKFKIAHKLKRHDTIGIDLVAMCVNDILASGAEPLFFLDYLAAGKLNSQQLAEVIQGLAYGCRLSGCALLREETAEISSFEQLGEYDLAGFGVGVVDKTKLLNNSLVQVGDVAIGLAGSGINSNSFDLVCKILQTGGWFWSDTPDILNGKSLGDELIAPTQIYVKPILEFLATEVEVHGMASLNNTSLSENLPRCLNSDQAMEITLGSWKIPPIFDWLAKASDIEDSEIFKAFNLGIGFVVIVPPTQAKLTLNWFKSQGVAAFKIGQVVAGDGQVLFV